MKMPSELFAPGSVGDGLANDLARELANSTGIEFYQKGHRFHHNNIHDAHQRARAELAITWALKPEVREKLGGME